MTCSVECGGKYRSAKKAVTMSCAHCKKLFSFAPSKRRSLDNAHCSVSCSAKANKAKTTANKHKNTGGWKIGVDGYVVKYMDGKKVFQHRVVMEDVIGRKLMPYENVHHINGIKHDNRAENLELWVISQPKGQRVKDQLDAAKKLLEQHGYVVHNHVQGVSEGILFGAWPQFLN